MSEFKGRALYNPGGKAGEYDRWAINFYNGCTGGCEYCYNKRFSILRAPKPTLKACFKDFSGTPTTVVAQRAAAKELFTHRDDIVRDGGVFLSFVSDPCLPETVSLTRFVIEYCSAPCQFDEMKNKLGLTVSEIHEHNYGIGAKDAAIPVIVLTKQADWILKNDLPQYAHLKDFLFNDHFGFNKHVAFGFTLTGHDELEPGCSSNADRVKAMKILHDDGILTWASIEPVIDYPSSLKMIRESVPFCDHFKVGLLSGAPKGTYSLDDTVSFINDVRRLVMGTRKTVYWKQSIRDVIGGGSPIGYNFVEADWNIFTGDLDKRTF